MNRQTGREAINNLLANRPAEYAPVADSFWPDTMTQWATEGLPVGADGKPVNAYEYFEFDMAGCGGWFDWKAEIGFGEIVEETDEWKIERDGNGSMFKWWKNRSGTPEHIGFRLDNRRLWDAEYRPKLAAPFDARRLVYLDEWMRPRYREATAKGRWRFLGHQFIWENMRGALGDENLYMALVDDPDWIRDMGRVYTDLWKQAFELLFTEIGRPDGIWLYDDLGYKGALFCSPAILEELIFPYYREMVQFFHGRGLPVIFHSCGFQEPALPLIVGAGFDGLNPMEVKAGNDVFKFAERYGDRLVFVGGLDARLLETNDRAVIRRGITDFMAGMRARGARFLYGSDHSISTNVRFATFQYAMEVYRELRANHG